MGIKHLSLGGIDRKICAKAYGIVYCARNNGSGKRYVGITRKSLQRRIENHETGPSLLGRALRKYGRENFEFHVLSMAENPEALSALERFWISLYDCVVPNGYNLTGGGESSHEKSAETCRRISLAKTGKPRPDMKPEDLSGQRFGRLRVVTLVSTKPARWMCMCECGAEHSAVAAALKNGNIRSCGCLRRESTSARVLARNAARRQLAAEL